MVRDSRRIARATLTAAALLVVLAVVVAGCGDEAVPPGPSPRLDLGGPWQAEAFVIDQSLLPAAVAACVIGGAPGPQPAAASLVLADARGANRLYLLFVDGRTVTDCFLKEDAPGRFTSTGIGSGDLTSDPPGPARAVLRSAGVMSTVGDNAAEESTTMVYGAAGTGVAAVDLILRTGQRVRASTSSGLFAAWWPTDAADVQVQEIGPNGQALALPHS